jgi:hypothetical protein
VKFSNTIQLSPKLNTFINGKIKNTALWKQSRKALSWLGTFTSINVGGLIFNLRRKKHKNASKNYATYCICIFHRIRVLCIIK